MQLNHISLVDQKTYEMGPEDIKIAMKILNEWNGSFRSGRLERKKRSTFDSNRRSYVCSGKFPFDPRMPLQRKFWLNGKQPRSVLYFALIGSRND